MLFKTLSRIWIAALLAVAIPSGATLIFEVELLEVRD